MTKLKFIFAIVISAAIFSACKNKDTTECDLEGLVCTPTFTTKYVTIKTSGGVVVPIDSLVLKVSASQEVLFSETPVLNDEGTFKLISDNEFDDIRKEGTDVTLYGYIEGVNYVNENLRVGHDCCHVVYISGVQDIVVTYP